MPAYLIAEHIVTDDAKFLEYLTKARPVMAKHGGRYLTKTSTHKSPEGGHWKPDRVLIIEFPDMDAVDAPSTTRLSISRSSPFVSRAQAIKRCCSCLRVHRFPRCQAHIVTRCSLTVCRLSCGDAPHRRIHHHHRSRWHDHHRHWRVDFFRAVNSTLSGAVLI